MSTQSVCCTHMCMCMSVCDYGADVAGGVTWRWDNTCAHKAPLLLPPPRLPPPQSPSLHTRPSLSVLLSQVRWEECPKCQARMDAEGLSTEAELQSWFVRRISNYLAAKGRKLIGEGGRCCWCTVRRHREHAGVSAVTQKGSVGIPHACMRPLLYC